jgi:hypothetical protein
MKRLLISGSALALLVAAFVAARADVNYTQGAGTVIFDFICFTTKHCTAHVPIDSAGGDMTDSTNHRLKVDGSGVTQPVSGTLTANQGTANATPWNQNVSQWGGSAVGAMANYGTSPGAVLVPGVNAFVTNSNPNGQTTMSASSPVAIASDQSAVPIKLQANTGGGATPYTPFVPAATDNHQTVKNGAGTVFSVSVSNNSGTKNYARLYDAGTGFNGCNSATGVIFAFEIPPTDSGFTIPTGGANGLAFSTGLSLCITSGFGLTDTTAATASAMYVNVAYK